MLCQRCGENEAVQRVMIGRTKRGVLKKEIIKVCEECVNEHYPSQKDTDFVKIRGTWTRIEKRD